MDDITRNKEHRIVHGYYVGKLNGTPRTSHSYLSENGTRGIETYPPGTSKNSNRVLFENLWRQPSPFSSFLQNTTTSLFPVSLDSGTSGWSTVFESDIVFIDIMEIIEAEKCVSILVSSSYSL